MPGNRWSPFAIEEHNTIASEAIAQLAAIPNDLDARIANIAADPRVPPEGRERLYLEARQDAARQVKAAQARAMEALEAANAYARDARVRRRVDPAAMAHVNALIESGVPPANILERAAELGDVERIAALRSALMYWHFEDKFHDANELVEASEVALAELAGGDEARDARAALQLRQLQGQLEAHRKFATLHTEAGAHGGRRLQLHYELGEVAEAPVPVGSGDGGGDGDGGGADGGGGGAE